MDDDYGIRVDGNVLFVGDMSFPVESVGVPEILADAILKAVADARRQAIDDAIAVTRDYMQVVGFCRGKTIPQRIADRLEKLKERSDAS